MTIKVGINGFGRIGRNILRALHENQKQKIQIVAINDLSPIETLAHLLRFDSTFGPFQGDISIDNSNLIVNGQSIRYTSERDPANIQWNACDVDVVFECTGIFADKEKASAHIKGGAKKVIISAPAKNVDATIVYGVNHKTLKASDTIISNASCTTNCLTPIVKPLHEKLGIECGLMLTIHAYTKDQQLLDGPHKDLHRARAAALSMIPTKTGAAAAVGLVMPELNGKLDGYAIRVPTPNVSVVDLTITTSKKSNVEEVNKILQEAANGELKGILATNTLPLVSIDFNHNPHSSIADLSQTRVIDNMIKVVSWYDNEWGFSNRMLDVTNSWLA